MNLNLPVEIEMLQANGEGIPHASFLASLFMPLEHTFEPQALDFETGTLYYEFSKLMLEVG